MIKAIAKFIKDERGAESVEFGISSLVIAGGAAAGLSTVKDNLQSKTEYLIESIDVGPE